MTSIIESMDFTIIKSLGQGTFGTVYLCDNDQYKQCCVKATEIREKNESRKYNHLALIKREVYLLKNLKHPRIMKMLEHFRSEHHVFIVTEYIPNGTLLQLVDEYNDQMTKFSEKFSIESSEAQNDFEPIRSTTTTRPRCGPQPTCRRCNGRESYFTDEHGCGNCRTCNDSP